MYTIEFKLDDFAAAHRLIRNYQGKCANLHGHNYEIYAGLKNDKLNSAGFVIDFDQIKDLFNNWVMANIDHSVLIDPQDQELTAFVETYKQKHFVMPRDKSTTVENIAEVLFENFTRLLKNKNFLSYVTVYENKNSKATFTA